MLISHEVTFLDDKFAIGITNLTFSKPRYSRSITLNIIDVQLLNRVQLFETPWTHARLPYPSPSPRACSNSCPLSQWCHPTILSSVVCPLLLLPSILPSIRDFSKKSVLRIRWPNYWSFSFSISPSNEFSGLISFSIYWFDLFAVQGILKSLL